MIKKTDMKKIILLICIAISSCKTSDVPVVPQVTKEAAGLSLSYVEGWQMIYVNATKMQGNNCLVTLYADNKVLINQYTKKTTPPFFTTEINTSALPAGTYKLTLTTELETVTTTFVKE